MALFYPFMDPDEFWTPSQYRFQQRRPRHRLLEHLFDFGNEDVEMEPAPAEGDEKGKEGAEDTGERAIQEAQPKRRQLWLLQPRSDVKETPTDIVVTLDLPGVLKQDLDITLERGVLTLSATRKEEEEQKGEKYHRREIRSGKYQRSFSVPDGIDPKEIKAAFEDGVLKVTLKKPASDAQVPHKIEIE